MELLPLNLIEHRTRQLLINAYKQYMYCATVAYSGSRGDKLIYSESMWDCYDDIRVYVYILSGEWRPLAM